MSVQEKYAMASRSWLLGSSRPIDAKRLCGGGGNTCGGWVNRICWPYWMKWPLRVDFKGRRRQGSRKEKIGVRRMLCGWVGLIVQTPEKRQ